MYANYWPLLALIYGFVVLIWDALLVGIYLILGHKRRLFVIFLIVFLVFSLIFPFLFSGKQLTLREVASIYFFFVLSFYIPTIASLKISKSKSDFAAYLFVLSVAGFVIYVTGGQFTGLPPQ